MSAGKSDNSAKLPIVVRGTEILPTDTRQRYREKIARITLDSMVQFVSLRSRDTARRMTGKSRGKRAFMGTWSSPSTSTLSKMP